MAEEKTIAETIREKWEKGHKPSVDILLALREKDLESVIIEETLESLYNIEK